MSNHLESGAVLPHGLLGSTGAEQAIAGFNRTYKNTALKAGIVIKSYPKDDPKNITGLCNEYDVLVIEQNADMGATSIIYKNCMCSQGFGSIADYFEAIIRPMKRQTNKGSLTFRDQDGAIVLLQCLDGLAEKAIITSFLNHPDRESNLTGTSPKLAGEYNGVNILVHEDGSCSLIFKGATDSQGKPTNAKQGNTTVKIEKDGSYQVDHDSISFRMARDGTTTLKGKKDINLITDTNLNVTATKNVVVKCVDVIVNASGKGTITTGADANVIVGGNCDIIVSGTAKVKAAKIQLNGAISGITTENSHLSVIDLITGVPVIPSQTVTSDV